jgi:diguanylate cyclase (GGDEF)-like protein/PAS domain S-box-containing protein/putative nucleotidyltransferase with HDIG domain
MSQQSFNLLPSSEHSSRFPTGNRLTVSEQDHSLLSAIVNASDDAILSKTLDGIITTWNPAAERMFGYTAQEIIGQPKTILFQPDRLQEEQAILDRLQRGFATDHFETVRLHKDGTLLHVSVTISPIKDEEGQVIGASTIARDITARKAAEQQLRASEERSHRILESSPDCLTLLDGEGVLLYMSEGGKCLMEIDDFVAFQQTDWLSLWKGEAQEAAQRALEAARAGQTGRFQGLCPTTKGIAKWWDVIVTSLRDTGGSSPQLLLAARDITEQRNRDEQLKQNVAMMEQQNAELESQRVILLETNARLEDAVARLEGLATTDGLTGLKNHRAFQDRLKEEYDRAVRYNSPLALVLLNVDKFRQYNDTFGHPAGDEVLKQVAAILQSEVRITDIVARYGGEEFVLILPETDVEEARQLAERLRQALVAASWEKEGITASFGVATLSPMVLNATALLTDANKALFRSKHRGRNCVTHIVDAVEEETLDTHTLESFNALVQSLRAEQGEWLASSSAQVKETLVQSYNATIASWSRLLDLRDKETEGHSTRVTELMVQLLQRLGNSEQEVLFARWGARLHDIGKMGVPDHILHKPGPLTDEEWVIMRQHTTIAYEMLKSIEFMRSALDIPYCHHEKWDGSGYPRGLQGEEIPLTARLFAVVDVYDALTSDRPYRKAWSEEKVRAYLREQSGTHFDPQAVEAFLNMLQEDCLSRQATLRN